MLLITGDYNILKNFCFHAPRRRFLASPALEEQLDQTHSNASLNSYFEGSASKFAENPENGGKSACQAQFLQKPVKKCSK